MPNSKNLSLGSGRASVAAWFIGAGDLAALSSSRGRIEARCAAQRPVLRASCTRLADGLPRWDEMMAIDLSHELALRRRAVGESCLGTTLRNQRSIAGTVLG